MQTETVPVHRGFDRGLRVALGRAIEEGGQSVTEVARKLGKTRQWLIRKVDPDNADPRPLMSADVEEVLQASGVTLRRFLAILKDEITTKE